MEFPLQPHKYNAHRIYYPWKFFNISASLSDCQMVYTAVESDPTVVNISGLISSFLRVVSLFITC